MATKSTFSPIGLAAMKILTPKVEKAPVEAATDKAKTSSPVGTAAMQILTPEKQKEIISNVFGKAPEVAPKVEKAPVEAATDKAKTSYLDILEQKKKSLEEQKASNLKLARYNALGNALTSMVQPLGWAIGGGKSGVTGGVQKYDDRQYLEAFNRAVKASDELKNLGSAEAEYQFKIDEEARQRAIAEEQRQKTAEANIAEYEAKRALDKEYGLNVSQKKANILQEAIDNWTHYASKEMSLLEYVDSLNATGYFGDDFRPDRETLARIEKQINERRKKAATKATVTPKTGGNREHASNL